MKKRFFFLVLFVICCGLGGYWFFRVKELKTQVVALLEENAIQYESVKTRGLPFTASVEIKNPRQSEVQVDGIVTVGVSFFATKAWINFSGKASCKGVVLSGDAQLHHHYFSKLLPMITGTHPLEELIQSTLSDCSLYFNNIKVTHMEQTLFQMARGCVNLKINPEEGDRLASLIDCDFRDYDFFSGNKSNTAFTMRLTSKRDWKDMFPISCELEKMISSDQFFHSVMNLTLDVQSADPIDCHLKFHAVIKPKPGCDVELFKQLCIKGLLDYPSKEIREFCQSHKDQIAQFIPNLNEFGTLAADIDVAFDPSKMTIKNYEVKSDLYSISFQGDCQSPYMTGSMTFQVENHQAFFHDLAAYYSRARAFALETKIVENLPLINEGAMARVVPFLESLSHSEQKDRLAITIQYQDPAHVKIGPLEIEKFAASLGELLINPLRN